jgi:UPF0271 protein
VTPALPPPFEPFGDAAWRFPIAPETDRRRLLDTLRGLPQVVDAVVTEEHALVTFVPGTPPAPSEVASACASCQSLVEGTSASATHSIRVHYDGPDLDDAAKALGLAPAELIARHASGTYFVATVGFQPGFAYLRGLDPRLHLPRRATPRARIPALSLGMAGPYTGVYPFASPGGWNLLGRVVGFVPFDSRTGARLGLGEQVRFTPEPP